MESELIFLSIPDYKTTLARLSSRLGNITTLPSKRRVNNNLGCNSCMNVPKCVTQRRDSTMKSNSTSLKQARVSLFW